MTKVDVTNNQANVQSKSADSASSSSQSKTDFGEVLAQKNADTQSTQAQQNVARGAAENASRGAAQSAVRNTAKDAARGGLRGAQMAAAAAGKQGKMPAVLAPTSPMPIFL